MLFNFILYRWPLSSPAIRCVYDFFFPERWACFSNFHFLISSHSHLVAGFFKRNSPFCMHVIQTHSWDFQWKFQVCVLSFAQMKEQFTFVDDLCFISNSLLLQSCFLPCQKVLSSLHLLQYIWVESFFLVSWPTVKMYSKVCIFDFGQVSSCM